MAASPIGSAALADDKGTRIDALVPSVCVFDVNETLLDIEFIAPLFQRLFGDRKALREWFGQLILYSEAITLSGAYATFFNLGQGVLKMLGSMTSVRSLVRRASVPDSSAAISREYPATSAARIAASLRCSCDKVRPSALMAF